MRRLSWVSLVILMLWGLGGAVATLRWLERESGATKAQTDPGYVFPPAVARRLTFGYHRLAADLMWIRVVQYFGKHLGSDSGFPALRHLLDLTVGLDPEFVDAYRYGGLFLWVAGDIPGTTALLEEGYRHNPTRWELPHDLGRIYFLQLHDYAKALRWWAIAHQLPDSPAYLPRFIARLYAKVGHRETALELWTAILNDPKTHEDFRKIAREEIERLQATPPSEGSPQ